MSELALCIDMDLKPTIDELIDTFLNKEDVEKMVKAPVRDHFFLQYFFYTFESELIVKLKKKKKKGKKIQEERRSSFSSYYNTMCMEKI